VNGSSIANGSVQPTPGGRTSKVAALKPTIAFPAKAYGRSPTREGMFVYNVTSPWCPCARWPVAEA
jgi:hypothetical protein